MSLERARQLVDSFNDGEFEDEIEPYFNDLITFFKFVKKYNLLDEIELDEIRYRNWDSELINFLDENGVLTNLSYDNAPEELKNILLLKGLEDNYEDTVYFIIKNLITDVEIRNGGFYLRLRDREELSDYFCSGSRRSDSGPRHVAKLILSEDGLGHDWYYDSSMTPYDTVDVLNDSNITHLKDVIYKKIGNQELSLEDYDSDFFEHLSEIQETEGYFRIRPEDLNDLLKDSDASNELFKKDLEDIGDELRSIYYNSENTAYEDEVYDAVYKGLSEYFEGHIDEVPRKVGEKTKYDQYIKIRDFIGIIKTFLQNNEYATWSDSFLEYFGGYTSLINNMIYNDEIECIDIRIPDYPDWDRTRRNINEMFLDYI
jgi:hypothetical protein